MTQSALDGVGHVASPKTIVPLAWMSALVARRRDGAGQLALGTTIAFVFTEALKRLVARRRPRLFDASPCRSFPSGHSAASTAYLVGLAFLAPPRFELVALVAASLGATAVNVLRVVSREHWPGDVIAGDVVGVAGIAIAHAVLTPARREAHA